MRSSFVARAKFVLRRFAPSEDGAALVEFAFAVPILVMLAVGAFDFGLAFQQKHRLAAAAQAGTQLVAQDRGSEEVPVADIEARVREEAGDTVEPYAVTVTPRYYCTCFGGTAEQACTADPDAVCPAGNTRPLLKYIEVDVQRQVDLVFSYPGVAESIPLQARATMRVN